MTVAWDEAKRASNLAKHGVDFATLQAADFSTAWVRADTRMDYGEVRLFALVPIADRLHALVYTVETRAVRIISLRLASQKEVAAYVREAEIDSADT